jgi:hypothetical protein
MVLHGEGLKHFVPVDARREEEEGGDILYRGAEYGICWVAVGCGVSMQ